MLHLYVPALALAIGELTYPSVCIVPHTLAATGLAALLPRQDPEYCIDVMCGGVCMLAQTAINNCTDCPETCPGSCVNGICTCDDGNIACGVGSTLSCPDYNTSYRHCGRCDNWVSLAPAWHTDTVLRRLELRQR